MYNAGRSVNFASFDEDEWLELARDDIQYTLDHQRDELELREYRITQLPAEIWSLTHLKTLKLDTLQLTEIRRVPRWIASLPNLKTLVCPYECEGPPRDIINQGIEAIKVYLQSRPS